jgi:superfamily II DNA or RNA helicase
MARRRHFLDDPRVQAVVARLIDGFLQFGSVNALAEALSSAAKQRIYPNRIHGLLAEDRSRTVTTSTLDALESAFTTMPNLEPQSEATAALEARVRSAAAVIPDAFDQIKTLAASLELPAAVVRRLLVAHVPSPDLLGRAPDLTRGASPDWSWQDQAVDRVLRALADGVPRRVGLVVPTGGGKTRLGLRCVLNWLDKDPDPRSVALWVTHRRRLHQQARRSLQQLLREIPDLPHDSAMLFESRVRFVMVNELAQVVREVGERATLLVLDEAHHAAAPSYEPLLTLAVPGIFLTATPVRSDSLPIGVDQIAYTITYKELFERCCVIEPVFDPPLDLPGLNWADEDGLRELADYLLERTEYDFGKVLVAVSQQDRAERLYAALLDLLDERQAHRLSADDVSYIHGSSNSFNLADASDALDESAGKPAGILVATSQLVGEGYDDPLIDAVVVTYPSTSTAHLMQVAGRALRWAPGKNTAHVVQVRESSLQYYFEQRWLYQDISDELRPNLVDYDYNTVDDLRPSVQNVLAAHNVAPAVRRRILDELHNVVTGATVRLLLIGINYYGSQEDFGATARWNALLVDDREWPRFLNVFNSLSIRRDDIKDAQRYLAAYLPPDSASGSSWKSYMDLINAAEYARREIAAESYPGSTSRPYRRAGSTTWLRYVTFRHAPTVPTELDRFLGDAVNRTEVLVAFMDNPAHWSSAVRVALPLAGSVAYLLDERQDHWLTAERDLIVKQLLSGEPDHGFRIIFAWRQSLTSCPVPVVIADHIGQLVSATGWEEQRMVLKG